MGKKTPLYQSHLNLGAKMIDFNGWDMPVQYSSVTQEHLQVRAKAGLFDLCHMGRISLRGAQSLEFLQSLVTIDVAKIPEGRAKYTFFCNEKGGVVDDLLVYREQDGFFLVVNASNTQKVLVWLAAHKGNRIVEILDQTQAQAMIALQGPASLKIMGKLITENLSAIPYYGFTWARLEGIHCRVGRSGYTGEDGFELFCQADQAAHVWDTLIQAGKDEGVMAIGLGARDTLRLEMAFPLYGHEIDDQTGPMEAGLSKFVDFDKGEFIGKQALKDKKEKGVEKKLVGLVLQEKGIPRQGYPILKDNKAVGAVASGTFSPSLEKGIATAYIQTGQNVEPLFVEIRGKGYAVSLAPLPFYKRKK